jgi:uncharacterized protein YndB with AHSA1/START domain
MPDNFSRSITINASPSKVWQTLTNPGIITQWMGDAAMNLEVQTNWQVGSPITIKGFHHVSFENKGIVLVFEEESTLSYSHLDSISNLPDAPENYSTLTFTLEPLNSNTLLTLNLENFPTESIRKHLEFYWKTTLFFIKNKAEK